jgi:hypothetical protein
MTYLSEHESPLDASLEVVLPGLNQRLNALLFGNNRTHSSQDTHGQQLTQIAKHLQQLQTAMFQGFFHQAAGHQYLMQDCIWGIGRAFTQTGRAFTIARAYPPIIALKEGCFEMVPTNSTLSFQ